MALGMSQDSSRSRLLLEAILKLEAAVKILDDCQVGDWRGEVSPVKHAVMDAIAPLKEQIRQIAMQAYLDEQEQK
jgi:hypothetical protein